MANSIGWGKALVNNTIEYARGCINNLNSWGIYHRDSASGETIIYGLSESFESRVLADSGTVESLECIII